MSVRCRWEAEPPDKAPERVGRPPDKCVVVLREAGLLGEHTSGSSTLQRSKMSPDVVACHASAVRPLLALPREASGAR